MWHLAPEAKSTELTLSWTATIQVEVEQNWRGSNNWGGGRNFEKVHVML